MTRGKKGLLSILGIALAAVLLLAACEGNPSESEAEEAFCEDLANLQTSLTAVNSMGASASVDDFNEVADQVKSDFDSLQSSTEDLANTRPEVEALESAINDLDSAVDDLSGDATLSEALTSLQGSIDGVRDAYQSVVSVSIECVGGTSTDDSSGDDSSGDGTSTETATATPTS